MATETERKFLVRDDGWRAAAAGASRIEQFYLFAAPDRSLRVRIRDGSSAVATLKFGEGARRRDEYEYPLPLADALALRAHAIGRVLFKTRHLVAHHGRVFEIDEFSDHLDGLVLAELEDGGDIPAADRPLWLGREVTDDRRFLNATLALEATVPPR